MYSNRAGTSGIAQQLYETKLISLLSIRVINDDDIKDFELASNMDNIGAFDDICFTAKVKGLDKRVAAFIHIQAKHRENEKQIHISDLAPYFNSYMKIRQLFHSKNKELIFRDAFDETECIFVIYTTANLDLSDDSVGTVGTGFSDKLHYLIDTGGTVKQPYKDENNIEYLTKTAVKDQVTSLAERIAKFITENKNFSMMLTDEYVLSYHVILARQVFDISEIYPGGYRIASFRNDFFDTNEEHLILFKDTLFKEVLKKRRINPANINNLLFEYLAEPTDATRLSKLIGTIIKYNNGQLEFDKNSTKDFRPGMKPMDVSRSTVNKAVELAAREILSFQMFKVQAAFGNKDLTINGSDANIERRINYLASRINDLLDKCKSSKMVTIDESLGTGFLRLNGGIAGAVGNLFVLDDNTKQMKITDNWELLENLAQKLYMKLRDEHNNLHEYKFCVNVNKFPKLLFDSNEYERNLARDFLNKLLFFIGQADKEGVEECLLNDLNNLQRNYPHYYQVKTDAIFIKYHDEILKWWKQPNDAYFLTRNAIYNMLEKCFLMDLINEIFMSKIKQYNYTFTEDAVRSLNLHDQHSTTIIVAENSVLLTVVKVMQRFKNEDYVVLDLEYIANLPTNDQNALRSELKNIKKVLILVCHTIDLNMKEKITLEDIAKAVNKNSSVSNIRTIIITNQKSLQIINRCFPKADSLIHDKKLCLFDVSEESQKSILQTATAILPGVEIRLDRLLKGWPMTDTR